MQNGHVLVIKLKVIYFHIYIFIYLYIHTYIKNTTGTCLKNEKIGSGEMAKQVKVLVA